VEKNRADAIYVFTKWILLLSFCYNKWQSS